MTTRTLIDSRLTKNHMGINISSTTIGIGILTFPRFLANTTGGFDGWISIVAGGIAALVIGWLLATLAARFPRQSFFEYTAQIATKPIAVILTFLVCLFAIGIVSFEIQAIGVITKQYLFYDTPVEMITLSFLWVVQYAVAKSRNAMLHLHLLFLPVVLLVLLIVVLFTLQHVRIENIRPFFSSDWQSLLIGAKDVGFAYSGIGVILFYTMLMKRPKEAPKAILLGISMPIVLYAMIYLVIVAVFSIEVVKNLVYPTIELAKEVEIPGGFFTRAESIFFAIWIMTIFNTSAMWYDVLIMNLSDLFKNVSKMVWITILSPIIYIISMIPQNVMGFLALGELLQYYELAVIYLIPICLLIIAKMRGVRGNE